MPQPHNKPFVIGVAGGSGSGKSTVTRQVLASIGPDMATVVYQDDYYLDQTHLSPEDRPQEPITTTRRRLTGRLMMQHLQALRRGESIEMPTYDFTAAQPRQPDHHSSSPRR
jgi:uridine kinase